jgi:beta-lactamase class A
MLTTMRRGGVVLVRLWVLVVVAGAACRQRVDAGKPTPSATPAATIVTAAPVMTSTARPATPTAVPAATATPTSTHVPPSLGYLAAAFDDTLAAFDGISSYDVIDLEDGSSIGRNEDIPISGMSMVKIAILLQTYLALDAPPTPEQTKLITETATLSGNYTANLLLELAAGQPDAFAGAERVTRTLRRLGLYDTFIAVPYDQEPRDGYLATYLTPANEHPRLVTNPDSSMQTTTRDLAVLLQMIYACADGTGPLLDVFDEDLTAMECAAILDVMTQNQIGAFIEEGVPDGVPVAHKHGWVAETHGDAAVVLADHPYVLVVALHRSGWLEWADSTVLIARLSEAAYGHFNEQGFYDAATLATPAGALEQQPRLATPTPEGPLRVVSGTGGAGVTLRARPGGEALLIVPEGSAVFLAPDAPQEAGGLQWQRIVAPGGRSGWVAESYLQAP